MESTMNGKENKPLRVAVYCRLASDDQISRDELVREYTKQIQSHENWTLVSIYMDIGVPASPISKRIELNRLLADCRKGKIDKILVKSISRLARNMQNCQEILRELTALGVSVRFEMEQIDTGEDTLWAKYMDIYPILARREAENLEGNRSCGCCTGWPTVRGRRFP